VYLQTTIDKQVARTQRDKRRPLLQNDDPQAVLTDLAKERNPMYEEVADYVVDTDDQSARAVANQIIDKVGL
jgi:shikimate kinase